MLLMGFPLSILHSVSCGYFGFLYPALNYLPCVVRFARPLCLEVLAPNVHRFRR